MGRKKIQITRIVDERNRQVSIFFFCLLIFTSLVTWLCTFVYGKLILCLESVKESASHMKELCFFCCCCFLYHNMPPHRSLQYLSDVVKKNASRGSLEKIQLLGSVLIMCWYVVLEFCNDPALTTRNFLCLFQIGQRLSWIWYFKSIHTDFRKTNYHVYVQGLTGS